MSHNGGQGSATNGAPRVSFEFFPPKTPAMEETLWETVKRLEPLAPHFVSVTYGAGGSTRERTHSTVRRIRKETALEPAAHLTCVGTSRADMDEIARSYWNDGIRHIVALRGDCPPDVPKYEPHPEGYAYAVDLIEGLRKVGDFEISTAAYPETHPDAPSAQFDIDYLKRKIDAGACRAITQFFFDNETFFRFYDRVRAAGVEVPVVPGVLPIPNFKQVAKFAGGCGATIPDWLADQFEGLDGEPETRMMVAASIAANQCWELMDQGFEDLHFYTLNRAPLTRAVCHMIGVRPEGQAS